MDTKELELGYINSLIDGIEKYEFTIKKLLEDKQESKDYYKIKRFLNKNDFDLSMEDIFNHWVSGALNGNYVSFSTRIILKECSDEIRRLYNAGYRE
jgi:hypothetical protein